MANHEKIFPWESSCKEKKEALSSDEEMEFFSARECFSDDESKESSLSEAENTSDNEEDIPDETSGASVDRDVLIQSKQAEEDIAAGHITGDVRSQAGYHCPESSVPRILPTSDEPPYNVGHLHRVEDSHEEPTTSGTKYNLTAQGARVQDKLNAEEADTTGRDCPAGVSAVKDASTEPQTDAEQGFAASAVQRIAASAWGTILRPFFLFTVQNQVYIHGVNQSIACVCYLNNDEVKNDVIQALTSAGFIRLLPLPENTQARRNEQVKIQVECLHPENLEILPNIGSQGKVTGVKKIEMNFSVNEVLSNSHKLFHLALRLRTGDLRKYEGIVSFKYSQTSEKKDKSLTLQKKWPLLQQASTHPVQHLSNMHIAAGKLNIGGQMTTTEIGTASRTMGGAETGKELTEQTIRQRGGTSSNVTAGNYNAGQMTDSANKQKNTGNNGEKVAEHLR